MKKNIAFVIGQLSLGGSEKQLYLLAKGLHASGRYNVCVIVLSAITEPHGSKLEKEGIRVISLRKKMPYFDIFRIIAFRRLISARQINILHSFSLTANYYSYFALLFNRNIKFFCGSRNTETDRNRLLQRIDDFIIKRSHGLITNSVHNLEFLKKISANSSRINGNVVLNGIEIPSDNSLNIKTENSMVTVGTVALFKKQKNYPLFIDLCESITNEYSNVNFISIGTGPDYEIIKQYTNKLNLESKINFLGNQSNALEIMKDKFDVFVLTSIKEGLPNVIMEAMSVGLPVVATDVGGVSELVKHGETGFLVPSGDRDELVKYCKTLIDDSKLRFAMGQKGRDFIVQNYSAEKMVREFKDIFESRE